MCIEIYQCNTFRNWNNCDSFLTFLNRTDQKFTRWAVCSELLSEWFCICLQNAFLFASLSLGNMGLLSLLTKMAASAEPSPEWEFLPEEWFQFKVQFYYYSQYKPLMHIISLFSCGFWSMRGKHHNRKNKSIQYCRYKKKSLIPIKTIIWI